MSNLLFYLFLLVIYSLIITYGIAYDKFLLIIVYVNRFSKDPYKIVPQPHYKQKWSLRGQWLRGFPYPHQFPVSHSHIWNHKRFLESTPQGFSQRRALRDFYGRNLPEKPASSLPFCRPARTLAMAKQPSFPQHRPSFSSRRHTVCSYSRASHSTSPIFPVPCA